METLLEGGGLGDAGIYDFSVDIAFRFRPPGAEFPAEEDVTDFVFPERGFQVFALVLGVEPAVGRRADVGDSLLCILSNSTKSSMG